MAATRVVLVTGSRAWPWRDGLWRQLDLQRTLVPAGGRLRLVHGANRHGADADADAWIRWHEAHPDGGPPIDPAPYPARWTEHHAGYPGKIRPCPPGCTRVKHGEQGNLRNLRMLDEEDPHIVVACRYDGPAVSRGTTHCLTEALARCIPAIVLEGHSRPRIRSTSLLPSEGSIRTVEA